MADPRVIQAIGPVFEVTLYTGITCVAGNLLAHNGTGWVLADPSTPATLSAKAVAMDTQTTAAGKVRACREVVIRDEDAAAYTINARYYLGDTAGSISATAPSTDGDLIQVVGVALSANELHVKIKPPRLEYAYLTRDTYDGTGEPGLGVTDAGWAGPGIDGAEAVYTQPFRVPENCIGLVEARLVYDSVNASAATLDVTVVGAYAGASNVQDTGSAIADGDFDQADTNDIILTLDISTVLDAGLFTPGRIFQIFMDADAITGEAVFLGGYLVYQVVD